MISIFAQAFLEVAFSNMCDEAGSVVVEFHLRWSDLATYYYKNVYTEWFVAYEYFLELWK